MRNFLVASALCLTALAAGAQSTPSATAAPKSGSTAKAPVHHTAPVAPKAATAVIETSVGTMTCTLFPDKAPIGVANFIGLATGTKAWKAPSGVTKHTPLYDGTIFHRVIPGFMIQGGDPKGDGTGGTGSMFKNEVSDDLQFDKPGRLAYANAGPGTNESQFFITEVATPHLNGNYTIFGQCDDATVALVKQITHMATDPSNDRPFRPVKIVHVKIVKPGATAAPAKKPATAVTKKPVAPAPKTSDQ